MTETAALLNTINQLAEAVKSLAAQTGKRLTREDLCSRFDCHRNTLAKIITRPDFPKPAKDGKWLLADVLDWEMRK